MRVVNRTRGGKMRSRGIDAPRWCGDSMRCSSVMDRYAFLHIGERGMEKHANHPGRADRELETTSFTKYHVTSARRRVATSSLNRRSQFGFKGKFNNLSRRVSVHNEKAGFAPHRNRNNSRISTVSALLGHLDSGNGTSRGQTQQLKSSTPRTSPALPNRALCYTN